MTETSAVSTAAGGPAPGGGRGAGGSERRGGERSEPPRSGEPPAPRPEEGEVAPADGAASLDRFDRAASRPPQARPDPQVLEKPARRRFTAAYKRRILEEADACWQPGQIGALLRREGLYSSLLASWRREREQALAQGLAPRKRGRKSTRDPQAERVARLEGENARLRQDLEQAKLIIDIQKKVSRLLGIQLADVSEHEKALGSGERE